MYSRVGVGGRHSGQEAQERGQLVTEGPKGGEALI